MLGAVGIVGTPGMVGTPGIDGTVGQWEDLPPPAARIWWYQRLVPLAPHGV